MSPNIRAKDGYTTFESPAGLVQYHKSSSFKAKAVALGLLLAAIGAFVGLKGSQAWSLPQKSVNIDSTGLASSAAATSSDDGLEPAVCYTVEDTTSCCLYKESRTTVNGINVLDTPCVLTSRDGLEDLCQPLKWVQDNLIGKSADPSATVEECQGTWVEIDTMIESDADRLEWVSDAGVAEQSCHECSGTWPKYLSAMAGTAESFMHWKHPEIKFTNWRLGESAGQQLGNHLAVFLDRIRSENQNESQNANTIGYSSIYVFVPVLTTQASGCYTIDDRATCLTSREGRAQFTSDPKCCWGSQKFSGGSSGWCVSPATGLQTTARLPASMHVRVTVRLLQLHFVKKRRLHAWMEKLQLQVCRLNAVVQSVRHNQARLPRVYL